MPVGGGSLRNNVTSGELADLERARAVVGDSGGLWVRRDGREWIIRDEKMLDRVRTLMEPLDALGKQQGAIGKKMAPLGKQQGVMGRKMGEQEALGGRMTAAVHEMQVKLAALVDEARAAGLATEVK